MDVTTRFLMLVSDMTMGEERSDEAVKVISLRFLI